MSVRIGLAGCGWISRYQIEGWRRVPGAQVVAVCDPDASRAESLAAGYEIEWVGRDGVRMMEDCDLDVLDIATPPESHKPLAMAAMQRGVHVLCQKPAALSLSDAQEMVDFAAERGVALYINEMLRFCPWFMTTFERLRSGAIGRPVFARLFSRTAGFLEVGPERRVSYAFREFLKASDRGLLLEETIHFLDVMRYLFGEPRTICAVTEKVSPVLRGEDVVTVVMRYSGMTALIEDSWSAHGPNRSGMEVEGSRGAMFLSHSRVLELHSASTGAVEEQWDFSGSSWDEQRPHVFAALFKEFLETVDGTRDRTAQARDNLKTLRLVLAAYQSAEEGREVTL